MAIPIDNRRRQFLLGRRGELRPGLARNWLPGMLGSSRLHSLFAQLAQQERQARFIQRSRTRPLTRNRSHIRTPLGCGRGRSAHRCLRASSPGHTRLELTAGRPSFQPSIPALVAQQP